jgi:NAD(P)-dependent dehydrogenase (short-subunit alcohol dehydrogenase family)
MSDAPSGAVVVTGAARGIGRSIAERLGADGRTVVVTDLTDEALADVSTTIRSTGGTVHAIAADLTDAAQVKDLASAATDAGPVLGIVNNAAFLPPEAIAGDGDLLATEDWIWDGHWDVDVRGTARVIQAFLPGMLAAGEGAIVNIGSMLGLQPLPARQIAYSVSKAAIAMLTRHVAVTYGARGVRCNAVAPGSILTPNQRDTYDDAALARKLQTYPATRLGVPDDVAAAVAYLLGPGSQFVNGQVLTVDGGVTSQLVL